MIYLSDLSVDEICTKSVNARFLSQVRSYFGSNKEVFPNIFGLDHIKRRMVEVLITGSGVLLKGDFGVGKTELAKSIFAVLKDYYTAYPVYAPLGCHVRENAIHLYNFLINKDSSALDSICPVCRNNYIDSGRAPSEIEVERVFIAEGSGFARIQGNEDIEPEKILGMYHLTRFAEIGDPFDPKVLEPGKMAQGSGGVIFVDELGLLNKEAQYALIQGLQEKHFTPTNSRMTFPVDFLFVSTTNSINEFQIHKAIQNRLVSIRVERTAQKEEQIVVKRELKSKGLDIIFPEFFLRYLVESLRKLNNVAVFLGTRSTIRAAQIASASASLENRAVVNYCDLKEAIYTEVLGQADDESLEEAGEMLDKDFPSIKDFLDQHIPPLEVMAPQIDSFEEASLLMEDSDDDLLEDIKGSLPEEEKSIDVVKVYLHAYLTGCVEERVLR